jgi:acyl-CoA dehydrogenase
MTDELALVRDTARDFFHRESVPNHERWSAQRGVDREFWNAAGKAGLLCAAVPEAYGGGGGTFAHEAIIIEEQARAGDTAFGNAIHSSIVAPYILHYGSEEQRRRWLPGLAGGELVGSLAMTEPGTGSDVAAVQTRARRDGDAYVLTGSKTFISNGTQCDLAVVVCKTGEPTDGREPVSLLVVETGTNPDGFSRGPALSKIGQHGQDTCELFFDRVRVPATNLLGAEEGQGFVQAMHQLAQERLVIAVVATAVMEEVIEQTVRYAHERTAFGQTLLGFQNTRFTLAECKTEATIARVFVDECIRLHLAGELDAETVSMAKWWTTEKQNEIAGECLQLHGGYGYMSEYPVARAFVDSRVQMIAGGTNEIMKEIIGRGL